LLECWRSFDLPDNPKCICRTGCVFLGVKAQSYTLREVQMRERLKQG
jgi:hypothetical protein